MFTDHKPLISKFRKITTPNSDKQARYLSFISEYVNDVVHIRGQENVVADCLSRPSCAVMIDVFDLPAIAHEQEEDDECKSFEHRLKAVKIGDKQLWCDSSTAYPRPFVPQNSRKAIFMSLHNISHPGVKVTQRMISSRYFWPNITKDVKIWCHECLECQKNKISRHTKVQITPYSLPSGRFESVHIDIVGPLPPAVQYNNTYTSTPRYLLTCIDRATKWIEAEPMSDITAASVASAFLRCWVSRFGKCYI